MFVVFLTVQLMPNMDGYECTKLIRKFEEENNISPKSFIVVVSGNFSKTEDLKVEGIDGYAIHFFMISFFLQKSLFL